MAQWLLANYRQDYDEIAFVFANTGQENEQTLEFVERCDKHFGLGVVWVEAVVHNGERRANTHRVTDFVGASRDGGPFEDSIKKYGIPNMAFPHCTTKLKLDPMKSYARLGLGWGKRDYHTAIGIRCDEIDRMASKREEHGIIYPLVESTKWLSVPGGMTKPQVNAYWDRMPFRLNLRGYQGNCKWCWKKSLRKHLTLHAEDPSIFDFPERMEREYGHCGPPWDGHPPRVFMRKKMSILEFRKCASKEVFIPAQDDAVIYPDSHDDRDLDMASSCEESCEVYSEENIEYMLSSEEE